MPFNPWPISSPTNDRRTNRPRLAGLVTRAAAVLGAVLVLGSIAAPARAQTAGGRIVGRVSDETGAVLPGVTITAQLGTEPASMHTHSESDGRFALDGLVPGAYTVIFRLLNFSQVTRVVEVAATGDATLDVVLQLSLRADVTVTGRRSSRNLADIENPRESLVGIAAAASQGAVTAAQLNSRPIMRAGEVLEAIPGVIISQHSGEGKANQYYLRGFNLDHGTDFSTSVAGVPVNLPTHGHGHGYSDLNFLIPELVTGAQYSKGPYYADQGDFSTAGSASINYANALEAPLVRFSGGQLGWARGLAAASPKLGPGTLLLAAELNHNDGPWERPDDYRRVNGVVRYSQGDALNGFSLTAMGYRATWNATDQVPQRAVDAGRIGRFGTLDRTGGGSTHRHSLAAEIQRSGQHYVTKASGFLLDYDLNLFSNFTYRLDNPAQGDQFEQADDRMVTGAKVSHRRLHTLFGRPIEHGFGTQLRHDRIGNVGLYRTTARQRLATIREDRVGQTSAGFYYQNEVQWSPVLRTMVGVRSDVYHFKVDSAVAENSGTDTAGITSPKGGIVFGPWGGTEFYANAGFGFHSNDARGATITVDPVTGEPADRVTPLARARGAEIGVRTVAIPRVQSTLTLWTLALDSELLFIGDAGNTEASRPSRRFGVEWTNYLKPRPWLAFEADLSVSRARFRDDDPAGDRIPGSVEAVASLTAAVENLRGVFAGARLRHFGPRALVEDDSVRSKATTLLNLQGGYEFRRGVRAVLDVFNVFDAKRSDIDYFYTSRLPGEPADGVDDIHFHPTLPRSARLGLQIDF
jgi:hypothetical protein